MNEIYDFIGLGYGPSNIGINICIQEYLKREKSDFKFKFFERKPFFNWHSGMLLPDTYLQVSFLKDLVTQRNPRSKFTFVNFLFETGRLDEFINIQEFQPTRKEFEAYLKWITEHFAEDILYGHNIKSIRPNTNFNGQVETIAVVAENLATGIESSFDTRNISLALGGSPKFPKNNGKNNRVIHSSNFLHSLKAEKIDKTKALRFAVIGAGQSAIEILLYVYRNFPSATVDSIFSNFAYEQVSTSVFVNEAFFNKHVDTYFNANSKVKRKMGFRSTNYAVADKKELDELYRIYYMELFDGVKRLNILNLSKVDYINASDDSVELEISNEETGTSITERYDYVFLGTGFTRNNLQMIAPLKEFLQVKEGELEVNRDYSVKTKDNFLPKIFLQGYSEKQHGITNTLLSVIPSRSDEITQCLVNSHRAENKLINNFYK